MHLNRGGKCGEEKAGEAPIADISDFSGEREREERRRASCSSLRPSHQILSNHNLFAGEQDQNMHSSTFAANKPIVDLQCMLNLVP